MAAIDRGLDSLSFLSDTVREALRRRLRELGGLALIVLATLVALALATWSVQDPSLSHATNAPVRNILGVPGATVADLLTQLFGVAALAFILPIAIWGWRLVTHRPMQRERNERREHDQSKPAKLAQAPPQSFAHGVGEEAQTVEAAVDGRHDVPQPNTATRRWSACAVVSWSCTMATRM